MPIVQLLHRKIRGGKFAIPPEYDGENTPRNRAKKNLCKSDIFSNSVKEETERNQPCNHGNCKLCSSIAASNKITNKQNNKKFEIKNGGTCRTKNICC